jgi:hypothetical protein
MSVCTISGLDFHVSLPDFHVGAVSFASYGFRHGNSPKRKYAGEGNCFIILTRLTLTALLEVLTLGRIEGKERRGERELFCG